MNEVRRYLKLRLNRVDVVDKGANPGAHITLAKRALTEERLMAESKDVLPEGVAKRLADLEAEKVTLNERVAKAEAEAKETKKAADEQAATVAKLLEDRAKDAALVVAKSMPSLGKTDEIAHLLFVAKRAFSPEDYAQLEKTFKASNDQIAKGKLFAVSGSDSDGDSASQLDQMIAKRRTEKNETHAQAYRAVMETPEGKQAYAELRGGN